MKTWLLYFLFFFTTNQLSNAQSTAQLVYNIFETSCTFSSCHNNDSQIADLDLEGSGPNKLLEVYNNLVGVSPNNNHASAKGYQLIKPGDVKNSFLFRKINNELESTIALHEDELDNMPRDLDPLEDEEIELVRQWILHGAPLEGSVIDPDLIEDFYNNNGIRSVANPPMAPSPEEGFQLHLGPFFLPPGVEREVYLKQQINMPEGLEIKRIETEMGSQSHHFILYRYYYEDEDLGTNLFDPPSSDNIPEGFRIEGAHLSGNIVSASQNSEAFEFPKGTAIFWRDTSVLDLNSHYINTTSSVLSCDVYINIYTQPTGSALHEMKTGFIPYLGFDFAIPNDGVDYTFSSKVPLGLFSSDDIYMWAVSSHTHQWGQDYDIYKLNENFSRGEHIYDASCLNDGVPGCLTEVYDYQHPPTRVFDDYYEIKATEGFEHEAVFNNTGPRPNVGWGNFTSEDEMMLFIFYYLQDIQGLNQLENLTVDTINFMPSSSEEQAFCVSQEYIDYEGSTVSLDLCGGDVDVFDSFLVDADDKQCITFTLDTNRIGNDTVCIVTCNDLSICDTLIMIIENNNIPTGSSSQYLSSFQAFPNPFSKQLTLQLNEEDLNNVGFIVMNDVMGRAVIEKEIISTQESVISLNTDNIKAGIYLLNVFDKMGKLMGSKKFIHE